jgi:1-aminocyclopropane-1-carboxylate deaminase/D-cysteine desulfhydrase-like pyridoxal-dependent ACC family enzyme
MPHLRAALGGENAGVPHLWVKRDDAIGLAVGGNKVRKLAYLLADAQRQGARKVVSFGGLQSNFLRAMASACARCGLEAHCLYFEHRPHQLNGNLLLADLMGARLHFVPLGGNSSPRDLPATTRLVRLVAHLHPGIGPRKLYFLPVGGHTPLGCLGYVPAAMEILQQAQAAGFQPHLVLSAAGTGGTLAGLLAGFHLLQAPIQLVGVDVGNLWRYFQANVAAMASGVTDLLGRSYRFPKEAVQLVAGFGAGYAQPYAPAQAAIQLAASTEGLILDPVYSGKALAGLIELIRQERFRADQHVVFLHTGGTPALFALQVPATYRDS